MMAKLMMILIISSFTFCASSSSSSPTKSSSKSTPKKKPEKVTTCLVDKCAVCPDKKNITCNACKDGWYLRTFVSGDKTYNACWSISKLVLSLLGALLLSLLLCGICAICYNLGKRAFTRVPLNYPDVPTESYSPREITQPKVYVEEPVYEVKSPPTIVRRPEPIYEVEPAPKIIRRAPITAAPVYSSPLSSHRVLAPSTTYRSPMRPIAGNSGVIIRPGRVIR